MKKFSCVFAMLFLMAFAGRAQSKVFREVNNEISSQMKLITQDEALIGYLVFTQLEKASKDSFNYQVSIMDENLNDIGKLNFRDKNLELRAVSFEQDILCLVYLKSDLSDVKNTSMKKIRKAMDGSNTVYTQLINLKGEILHSHSVPVDLEVKEELSYMRSSRSSMIAGRLKQDVDMKNIPGKGFACFYGDQEKNRLLAFGIDGKELWSATVPTAEGFNLLTTKDDVYLLSKKKTEMKEGGFEVRGYDAAKGTAYDTYSLKDNDGRQLRVISFDNDPVSGKPVLAGNIINKRSGNSISSVTALSHGPYDGVFTVYLNGPRRSQIKEVFSYWSDGSKAPSISATGRYQDNDAYSRYFTSIRDYKGNTYFAGPSYVRKPRIGKIITAVILSPLIIVSPLMAAAGFNKAKETDVMVLRQDSAGRLSFTSSIPGNDSRYIPAKAEFGYFPGKAFYRASNSEAKANYIIVDAADKAVVYNVDERKIIRSVPHRSGGTSTYIYPAKEGHIMVVEYNRAEKYTKLSIESL
jgi:hypothetical protein